MIKNVIFDLDNTIIRQKQTDALYYQEVLEKLGYRKECWKDIYQAIDDYEHTFTEEHNLYDRQNMLDFINMKLSKNYPLNLIDEINRVIGEYWISEVLLEEKTLKYLSRKYNLYVYTNWFTAPQAKRLEEIGYLPYFKKVLGADIYGSKPFISGYQRVIQEVGDLPQECIMIGDDKLRDVWGATRIGMKAVLMDYNGKKDNKEIQVDNYTKIIQMSQLEKIL